MGVARTIRLKAFLLFFVACIATTIFFRPGLSPNIKNPHYASDTTKASSGTKSGTPKAGSVEGNDNALKTIITSSKAAAIVESRLDPKLIPIFLHFSAILGPDWPIVMFTTNVTYTRLMTSPPPSLSRLLRTGGLILKLFPAGVGNLEVTNDYSDFLTRTYMWEELAPAENILVFQSDSMLCSKAPLTVEDFLEFDFIGAPYDPNHGKGFNGGLSLRKRSSTLRVLSRFVRAQYEMPAYEDQWYYERLLELQAEDMNTPSEGTIKLPTFERAREFSVEAVDYPTPVGVHQARRYPKEEKLKLEDYCPEFKLSTGPWTI